MYFVINLHDVNLVFIIHPNFVIIINLVMTSPNYTNILCMYMFIICMYMFIICMYMFIICMLCMSSYVLANAYLCFTFSDVEVTEAEPPADLPDAAVLLLTLLLTATLTTVGINNPHHRMLS